MIDEKTINRDYPKPHPDNWMREDVERIRTSLGMIDGDVHDLLNGATKTNPSAVTAPTIIDDAGAGYEQGSMWYDMQAKRVYICLDPVAGAAVWMDLTIALATSNPALEIVDGGIALKDGGIRNSHIDPNASIAQSKLSLNTGTGPNDLVQLDGNGKIPVLDGSQLTHVTPPDNSVTSLKIADNTILNSDISPLAAIATNKLSGPVTSIPGHGLALSAFTDALNAGNINNGLLAAARMGTGEANSSVFLRGDNTWGVPSGGKVKQVVFSTSTTRYGTNSSSFQATGHALSISPSAPSSKVAIWIMGGQLGDNWAPATSIYRGSTNLGDSNMGFWYSRHVDSAVGIAMCALDSPNTTSNTSYSLRLASKDGHTVYINPNNSRKPFVSIMLMEILV